MLVVGSNIGNRTYQKARFSDMATKVRDKLLQKCLTDLFALSNQELEDTQGYITVLRYRTAGRVRTSKDFEEATTGIEQRMAARGITVKDIEAEIRKVRQTKNRR
jgi:hypothetical protein